jgi:hypothetical protein
MTNLLTIPDDLKGALENAVAFTDQGSRAFVAHRLIKLEAALSPIIPAGTVFIDNKNIQITTESGEFD